MHKSLKESCLFTMNSLLGSLLALATFVALCNAHCFFIYNEPTAGSSPGECKDLHGVSHQLNSEWNTEECERCVCSEDGISCCSVEFPSREWSSDRFAKHPNFKTDDCTIIFNKETCSYTMVEKKNPQKPCFFQET